MAEALSSQESSHEKQEREEKDYYGDQTKGKLKELVQTLPRQKGWMTGEVFLFQGFWLSEPALKGALLLHNHFKARPTDIFLASFPKCGTTWLRALLFATLNRSRFGSSSSNHPLLTTGPHDCFPYLDFYDQIIPICDHLPSPRLFATHFPYTHLPQSAINAGSKFVYVWRDPKDTLVSLWHFLNKVKPEELPIVPLDDAFERFCEGYTYFGPFWDHVLGFFKASLEFPDKILLIRYGDLKREPLVHLKRLAEFLGQPFSVEEEKDGVMEDILRLCSFENLTNLEVNKTGVKRFNDKIAVDNHHFFRKGEVGDSKIYLTDEMIERLDQITAHKFLNYGLTF